jgi:hypothetical protein
MNSTDSTRLDDATIVIITHNVAYDCQINPNQKQTDTTTCKENGLGSLVSFHLGYFISF